MSVKPDNGDALVDTAMMLIKKLQKSKASKKTALLLAISIVLDVSLSLVVIFLGLGLSDSNSQLVKQSVQLRSDELSICNNYNSFQDEFLTLWKLNTEDFHNTATGKSFLQVVQALDVPVNCQLRHRGG